MATLPTDTELVARIEELKAERDAVILAHFYVEDAVQDVADHTGDSYNLSKLAADLDCATIVFAGVQFMGESAKLLSPNKTVILPNPQIARWPTWSRRRQWMRHALNTTILPWFAT